MAGADPRPTKIAQVYAEARERFSEDQIAEAQRWVSKAFKQFIRYPGDDPEKGELWFEKYVVQQSHIDAGGTGQPLGFTTGQHISVAHFTLMFIEEILEPSTPKEQVAPKMKKLAAFAEARNWGHERFLSVFPNWEVATDEQLAADSKAYAEQEMTAKSDGKRKFLRLTRAERRRQRKERDIN